MKAEKNKLTQMWAFGDSGFIYKTEEEAYEKGRKLLSIKLSKILKDVKIPRNK